MFLAKSKQGVQALWASRSGSFAMMTGLITVPLLLAVGLCIDFSIASRTRANLQEVADGASLAMAASRKTDLTELQILAEQYVAANLDTKWLKTYSVEPVVSKGEDVSFAIKASVDVPFMHFANVSGVPVQTKAVATRAIKGSLEVSLVLDNTWSMSEKDAQGVQKITALRDAATLLVNQLLQTDGANVRVAVVPYADYVNVGVANRSASWLTVPADTSTTSQTTCTTVSSESVCTKRAPSYSCTSTTDGVTTTGTCTGACTEYTTKTYEPPQERCTAGKTTNYTFYGCVGSRKTNSIRLSDGNQSITYPGFIATSRACPAEILPLTNDKKAILASIAKMTPNNGSYKPSTYIPAGLIWGLNTLSPTAPYTEGVEYDPANLMPRKVVVLMTDGDNTLRYNATIGKDSADGRHVAISTNSDGSYSAAGLLQVAATNNDTRSLCANIKAGDRKIEIFSVALAVDNDEARGILQGCASNSPGTLDHYYDASDAVALASAFTGIAQKLSSVRLKE